MDDGACVEVALLIEVTIEVGVCTADVLAWVVDGAGDA